MHGPGRTPAQPSPDRNKDTLPHPASLVLSESVRAGTQGQAPGKRKSGFRIRLKRDNDGIVFVKGVMGK